MKFSVMYHTLGMTLCAGELEAESVDSINRKASELLENRHVKKLDGAEIVDANGKQAAVLYLPEYISHKKCEFLTIRD